MPNLAPFELPAATATALPLYLRIAELLTREIAAGHYRSGERLPAEETLAQRLGVATGTLRKGLDVLRQRGLLVRRQGSGTYVRSADAPRPEGRSIYEFFRLERVAGGGLPTAAVLDLRSLRKPAHVPDFGAGATQRCHRLRRLRCLNGEPVALEEIWFDARHVPALREQALSEALYQFYQQSLGFWIARVEDRVGTGQVPDWTRRPFGPEAGQACGMIERWSWAGSGLLEEYSTTWFDATLARYVARWS
ncbi:MAG: GntR family transcriptional regulator [Rhodoferax sp.]|nr:GntR family transcriptional regulator [Rhodoferax sp.]